MHGQTNIKSDSELNCNISYEPLLALSTKVQINCRV